MEDNSDFKARYFKMVCTTICYHYFYNKTFSTVVKYVNANNGTTKDAEDIYNKATAVFLERLFAGEFNFMVVDFKYDNVCRLLISICKELWDQSLMQE